ncbi:MAG: deoxyribodipyrimidine photo-lyase [Bacteroidota bacterium]
MKAINIVWFKRDLRLADHAALSQAAAEGLPVLLLYCFEPSLMAAQDYDLRHWRFVWQSLEDMQLRLGERGHSLLIAHREVLDVLGQIQEKYKIRKLYSYQESGLRITYDRDKAVQKWCRGTGVSWQEYPYGGVIRALRDRKTWPQTLVASLKSPQEQVDWDAFVGLDLSEERSSLWQGADIPLDFKLEDPHMQVGGESRAWRYLQSFLKGRYRNYNHHISQPEASRKACSRLSPYIAWGNVSIRQVFQASQMALQAGADPKALQSFRSRLLWHDHFIQKFEAEDRQEFENLNRGYDLIRRDWNEAHYRAWEQGHTGYPLVDAAIRCVKSTGYLNFRLRAMLVSFLTHHLWLDWKRGALFLGRMFLDFEPGIHYPQFQMQSGATGVNTLRIYNPLLQSQKNDPEAVFITKWLPELAVLPIALRHRPWQITAMEESFYGFRKGEDYPLPIVDIKKTHAYARDRLWQHQNHPAVQKEARRILGRHVNRDREKWALKNS